MEIWAEAGACEGDMEYAMSAADAVKRSGADALKVQWLTPEKIFHPDAPRYDKTPGDWDTQTGGYRKLLTYAEWSEVVDYTLELGIEFIPAVFDFDAVERVEYLGLVHAKVASGDITNESLVKYVASVVKHITISTGASTMDEVERAVSWAQSMKPGIQITLLACHLEYPSDLVDAHLGRMIALRDKFPQLRIGYSDHTPGIDSVTLAYLLGAQVLEKHFTLTGTGGGDHSFGVTPDDLTNAVNIITLVERVVGDIELTPTPGESAALIGARRSLYAASDISKGDKLSRENTIALRPHDPSALDASQWSEYVERGERGGIRAAVDIPRGTPITIKMVGNSATLTVE